MKMERLGVLAVASVAAELGQIWRDTDQIDVGIDGELEFVDAEGYATGRIVAVQVKSGTSYFKNQTDDAIKFYASEKHRAYWERFPVPVLLILHHPELKCSYWTDARQSLRSPATSSDAFIAVPKSNVLQTASVAQLFENVGVNDDPFIADLEAILTTLIETRSKNGSFPISYFDLFTQGLTNICRSLYFGMDLAMTAAEANLSFAEVEFGLGVGSDDHDFLFDFVRFLVAQHLAHIDFADCLIDWIDRKMQPSFVAPLTTRGRKLVKLISEAEDKLVSDGRLKDGEGLRVAQEGFFAMELQSYGMRVPRIAEFQKAMIESQEE